MLLELWITEEDDGSPFLKELGRRNCDLAFGIGGGEMLLTTWANQRDGNVAPACQLTLCVVAVDEERDGRRCGLPVASERVRAHHDRGGSTSGMTTRTHPASSSGPSNTALELRRRRSPNGEREAAASTPTLPERPPRGAVSSKRLLGRTSAT
jgi:hypothetical protein